MVRPGDFQYFNDKGAVFPVETTYRNAAKIYRLDLPKTNDPLEHIAWRWVRLWTHWYDKARQAPRLHAGGGAPDRVYRRLQVQRRRLPFRLLLPVLARGHLLQAQLLKKVYGDIPVLIMEGDIVDISSYNEADTQNRIDAFIETEPGRPRPEVTKRPGKFRAMHLYLGVALLTYERVRLRAANPRFRHLASKFPPGRGKRRCLRICKC